MYSVAVLINSASKYREPKVIFLAPLLITAVSIFFFHLHFRKPCTFVAGNVFVSFIIYC